MRTSKRKYKNNFSSKKKRRVGGIVSAASIAIKALPDVAKQAIMFTVVNSNPATKVSIPMICTVLNNITDEELKTEIAMNLGKVLVALSEMDISVIFSDENKDMLTESLSKYGVHEMVSNVIIKNVSNQKNLLGIVQKKMKGFAKGIANNSKAMMELVSEMCKHTESFPIPVDIGMFASKLNDLLKDMESAIRNNKIQDIVNKLKELMKGEKTAEEPAAEAPAAEAEAPAAAEAPADATADTTTDTTADTTTDTTAEEEEEEEEEQSGGKRKRRNRTKRTKKRKQRKLRKSKKRFTRIN